MTHPLTVGVVGCGVAGLTASLLLARHGHRVTLLERAPALRPVGAGLLLQPSGQLALRHMGLLDEVTASAEPIDALHAFTRRRRTLVHLAYRKLGPDLRGYGVHRHDLFQVLHRHAEQAGVSFHLGVTVTGSRESNGTILALDDRAKEHGPFDALIAADGSRSRLRESAGLGAVVREFPLGAAWFSGRCDTVRGRLLQVTRGARQLIGLLPLGNGRCSLFCALPRGGRDAIAAHGLDRLKEEIHTLCPEAEALLAQLKTLDDLTCVRYALAGLKRWSAGRLVCIGDAAHATTPHLGQGVNLALLDALAIAEELHRGATPAEVPAALARAADFRRRQTVWCWRLSNLFGPVFQNEGWLLAFARDLALPWLPQLPCIGRLMVGTMAGLHTGPFTRLHAVPKNERGTATEAVPRRISSL